MEGWEEQGEAGTISGTSRATYLFKFMATSSAICLCQLMTGPDTKVMKTPRSDSTLVFVASRVKILHGFCGRRSNKKIVKCGYFLFKRKNRVSTVSRKKRKQGKSEKRNSRTYRENIKQEISRAKICMQVKSRKQDVNAAAKGCECVLGCVCVRVCRCVCKGVCLAITL